jgi:hypothetical protein
VPAFELIIVDQSFAHPHCRLRFFFILFFLSLSPFIIVAHYTMLPKPYLNAIGRCGWGTCKVTIRLAGASAANMAWTAGKDAREQRPTKSTWRLKRLANQT